MLWAERYESLTGRLVGKEGSSAGPSDIRAARNYSAAVSVTGCLSRQRHHVRQGLNHTPYCASATPPQLRLLTSKHAKFVSRLECVMD